MNDNAYTSLGWIESYFEQQAIASESVASDFRAIEAKAKLAPPSESFHSTDVPLPTAIKRVTSYIEVGLATKQEALAHLGRVEAWGKENLRKASNLEIEVAQLKSEVSQTQNAKQKASEDWKRLVYIEPDENGHVFVYVKPETFGETEFAVGEAYLNSALQVEFIPQPDVALTIPYLDAISVLLKNKAHELPVRDV